MPKDATAEDAKVVLDRIRADLHRRFPGAWARLEQLDCHLATVAMVIDHLFDEADRG